MSVNNESLKCEKCGLYFSMLEDTEDFTSVDESGMCLSCNEEIDVKIL